MESSVNLTYLETIIGISNSYNTMIIYLGCMLAWLTLIKYLEHNHHYSFVPRTLGSAFPIVLKAMVGILPIYVGYAFFGYAVFSTSFRFDSIMQSFFSLYAMMNGDSLWDTYYDLSGISFLLACFYLYSFIFFAIAYSKLSQLMI